MSTQFEEGRYRVQIIDQYFTESSHRGTPGFLLTFRVLRNLDDPEVAVRPYQRSTTLWLTKNTKPRVLHELHKLGYPGDTLQGVDPDVEGFYDFRGVEADMICRHDVNVNTKGVYEQWEFDGRPPKLKDKSLLAALDGKKRAPDGRDDNGGCITDADVPF
jgi:hypothetical protein